MRSKAILLCLLALLSFSQPCFAWGPEGHRIVARIAQDRLSPEAKAAVAALLEKDESLASVASWADEYRKVHTETFRWHFVNIPSQSNGYDATRDCANDDCVVARIYRFARVLGDRSQPRADRAMALKYLVHFIGDLHQPYHAFGDARGGNDIPVTVNGSKQCGEYKCELHGVWDEEILRHLNVPEDAYVKSLETAIRKKKLSGSGFPEDWANESLQAGRLGWVNPNTEIGADYLKKQQPIVATRLELGGARLGDLLNQIFDRKLPAAYQSRYLPGHAAQGK